MNFGDIHAAGAPILMAVGGCVVLLTDLASKRSATRKFGTFLAILFCIAAMVCSYTLGGQLRTAFSNGIAVEGLVVTMQILLAAIAARHSLRAVCRRRLRGGCGLAGQCPWRAIRYSDFCRWPSPRPGS